MDIIKFYLSEENVKDMKLNELSAYIKVMSMPMLEAIATYVKDNPNTEISSKLVMAYPTYINSMVAYITIEELAQKYKIFEFRFYELYSCILDGRFTAKEYADCINTIVTNENNLEYQFSARTSADYEACLAAVRDIPDVHNLVKNYKSIFYSGPREEARKTPMGKYLSKMKDLKLQQKCISYLDKLISMNIRPEEVPL